MTQDMPNTVAEAQMQIRAAMRQPRRIPAWKIVATVVLAAALGVIAISVARAAERIAAYEIVVYPAGKDLREDRPNLVAIAGPYAGREECRIAIASVKLANGARLRCDAIDNRRMR